MFRWYNEEKDPDYFVPDTDDEEEYEEADIEVKEINLSQFIVICSEIYCHLSILFLEPNFSVLWSVFFGPKLQSTFDSHMQFLF